MKNKSAKIVVFAVVVAVAVYLCMHVFGVFGSDVKTENAELYTAYDDITATGYFIRDEQLIEKTAAGVYDVALSDGERVKKGGVIATVYASERQADISEQISKIEQQIGRLTKSQVGDAVGSAEIGALEQEIVAAVEAISRASALGEGGAAAGAEDELTVLLNRKSLMLGEISGFDDEIAGLRMQLAELEAAEGPGLTRIYAPEAGYFVASADGYESVLSSDMVGRLTVYDLESLEDIKPDKNELSKYVGKFIDGFGWHMAALVADSQAESLTIGSSVTITFSNNAVPATVAALSEVEDGKRVVTMYSNYVLPELSSERSQTVRIIKASYEGIKIPREAVRVIDGQQGVFVQSGSVIKFKKIEIIFAKDNYFVARYDSSSGSGVALHDQIVVAGADLYDGKVIR